MSTQSCRMSRIPRIYPCKKVAKCEKRAILLGVKAYLGENYLTFSEHNWGLKVDWNSDPPLSRFWSKPRSEEASKGVEFDQNLFTHMLLLHQHQHQFATPLWPTKANQNQSRPLFNTKPFIHLSILCCWLSVFCARICHQNHLRYHQLQHQFGPPSWRPQGGCQRCPSPCWGCWGGTRRWRRWRWPLSATCLFDVSAPVFEQA